MGRLCQMAQYASHHRRTEWSAQAKNTNTPIHQTKNNTTDGMKCDGNPIGPQTIVHSPRTAICVMPYTRTNRYRLRAASHRSRDICRNKNRTSIALSVCTWTAHIWAMTFRNDPGRCPSIPTNRQETKSHTCIQVRGGDDSLRISYIDDRLVIL